MAATTKGAQSPNEAPAAGDAGKAAETKTPAADAQAGAAAAGKTGDEAAAAAATAGKEGQQSDKGGDSATQGKDGDAGDGKPKAPEKYELTVPDDAKRFVTDADLEQLQTYAKANDWTQEEAAAELSDLITAAKERQAATVTAWETTTKADKTYGGKNLAETQRLGNLAVDRVYPKGHPMREKFVEFLKDSGGGVRLEVVAFLADLGRMMGEDTNTGGKAPSGGGDRASKFYDHPSSVALEERAKGG